MSRERATRVRDEDVSAEDPIKRITWLRADCAAVRRLLDGLPPGRGLLARATFQRTIAERERELAEITERVLNGDNLEQWIALMRLLHPDAEGFDVPARFVGVATEPPPDGDLLADLDEAAAIAAMDARERFEDERREARRAWAYEAGRERIEERRAQEQALEARVSDAMDATTAIDALAALNDKAGAP